VKEVSAGLSSLDTSKATGPDRIPVRILKNVARKSHQVFVHCSITLYALGVSLQNGKMPT
jgi:hypothetical protein